MVFLVIPSYNESLNLPLLFKGIRKALADAGISHKTIVVDDGSRDDTQAVVRCAQNHDPIRLVAHPSNQGLAAALLTGLRASLEEAGNQDLIAVLEGDGTCNPAVLPAMIQALEPHVDIVIASRYAAGGGYRRFPPPRWILSLCANALSRHLFRVSNVRDYTIFYRLYRAGPLRKAAKVFGDRLTSVGGFACNVELLLRIIPFCSAVREVPFVYDYGIKKSASMMRLMSNLRSYVGLANVWYRELKELRRRTLSQRRSAEPAPQAFKAISNGHAWPPT